MLVYLVISFCPSLEQFHQMQTMCSQWVDGYNQEFIACCIMFSTFRACVGKTKDLSADKGAVLIIKKINGWRSHFDRHCKNVIKNHNMIESHRFNIDLVTMLHSGIYYKTDIQAFKLCSSRVELFENVRFFFPPYCRIRQFFFQRPEKYS